MQKIAAVLISLALSGHALAAEPLKMGVVVKVGGNAWFNSMEEGIKKEAAKEGINAWQVGPTAQDPAQQVKAIEDLIAQKVDIIGVVPVDPAALEPVLKKAKDAGIKVIVHESPEQKYADWDFELVDAKTFGERHMQLMAECMKEQGQYSIIVGSLTIPLHRQWAQSAIDYQKAHYPKMQQVGDLFGTGESVDDSMRVTNEMMSKYPDFKGMMAFGSPGPVGAGRAVQRRNAKDKVCVVGAYSPSQAASLVRSGDIKGGYIWNPMTAGELFVRIGKMVAENKPITEGTEIEGMGKIQVDATNHTIYGQNLESLGKDNLPKLIKMGL
ncbi:substrate-binding domain-containing protein [Enterobacteriaceae bacterium H20N1]|uniref:Substrate-binding domain-containing protein n=1 Tax=Dryocola boscaweniae TaxID=2925397 RepID=A0A9X2W5B5_9ENTR|nr:substrate-binding domain-containing protein [Dryocola boscaweniae]MCT4701035.1 substrate-binding domain-containing protein [Dryocola boscaweniae]MCT4718079.1 substrate-binding domain-containing protein [Dryocola boscaweniae]